MARLGKAMDRAGGMAKLLQSNDPSLAPFTPDQLPGLSDSYRAFARWKEGAKELRRALAKSGLNLPDGAHLKVATPDELSALERTARMCPRSIHPDHNSWAAAVTAHVELWRSCFELAMTKGTLSVKVVAPDHPDAEELSANAVAKELISELKGFKWLGARRGEKAGVLAIELSFPDDLILAQARARISTMGLSAQKRGPESIVEELVSNNLNSAVLAKLDRRFHLEAARTAGTAYKSLLTTPQLTDTPVLAIHVGTTTAPVAAALLDASGEIIASEEIPAGHDIAAGVAALLSAHSPKAAVLPASAGDAERLRQVESALGSTPTVRVLAAALKEARKDLELSPMIAGAVVLGRRALFPGREFSKVHPASLGLGEFSSELDADLLEGVLLETRLLARWERARKGKSSAGAKPLSRAAAIKRLNPLVKTIRDLKPGMMLDGIVTNLTRFGAFVNIGLSTEAMIHVSQLSTEFVDEPSQVVRVGQNVNARVLEVVPEKSRIALSLKPAPPQQERFSKGESGERPRAQGVRMSPLDDMKMGSRAKGQNPHSGAGPGHGSSDKKSRNEALADLDALFKK